MCLCVTKPLQMKGLHEDPLYKGFLKAPRHFAKQPIERGFCKASRGFIHTSIHTCTFQSFFLQIWGMLHNGGFTNPSMEGALIWGTLQSSWRLHTHIHTHTLVFFPTDMGVMHHRGLMKPLCRRGFMKPL